MGKRDPGNRIVFLRFRMGKHHIVRSKSVARNRIHKPKLRQVHFHVEAVQRQTKELPMSFLSNPKVALGARCAELGPTIANRFEVHEKGKEVIPVETPEKRILHLQRIRDHGQWKEAVDIVAVARERRLTLCRTPKRLVLGSRQPTSHEKFAACCHRMKSRAYPSVTI